VEFPVEDQWFECPQCGETGSELVRGDELQLVSFEIEGETASVSATG
jgi:Zn finger protein HypA/HybF involved in hydrogenase expression